MPKLFWTPQARAELESIYEYIAVDSHVHASIVRTEITNEIENCLIFPRMGRVVPEYADEGTREVFYKNYRIVYEIQSNNDIHILTIFHGSKLV